MTDQQPIRIAIVEDHPVYRIGLVRLLESQADFEVVGTGENLTEGKKLLDHQTPDVAIIDVTLQNSDGLDLVDWIAREERSTAALVVSMHDDVTLASSALAAGARGYVSKAATPDTLVEAIRTVHRGQIHVRADIADVLLRPNSDGKAAVTSGGIDSLSRRELQVFRMLGEGRGPRDIAARLEIAVKTVEAHQSRIREKLQLETMMQVRQKAAHWLATEPPGPPNAPDSPSE